MAETSKKKPRKSKLEVRLCLDEEELKNASTQLQETKEATTSLLPKLKNAIDDQTYFENPPTPVEFSIQVEVESCIDEDSQSSNILSYENEPETDDILLPEEEVVISNEQISREVRKLGSKTHADRMIQITIANYLGKYQVKHFYDHYEKLVQNALIEWKVWHSQSKIRTTILAYKCNICSIGWWHLGPFNDHIRIHENVSLNLSYYQHECYVVAAQGEWYESMCLCKIEGNCPKCLKSYEEHDARQKRDMYYHCSGCLNKYSTCSALFEHEGECSKYEKIIYQNDIPTESMWKCHICSVCCLTQARYEEHMGAFHSVRSDLPAIHFIPRVCPHCNTIYHMHNIHSCPQKVEHIKCKYCSRKFANKTLAAIHEDFTKDDHFCRICRRYLKKQCMEAEHLLKHHSHNYLKVYKCNECANNVLLAGMRQMHRHKEVWHLRKRTDKRRTFYDTIIVPKSCMTSKWVAQNAATLREMVLARSGIPVNLQKKLVVAVKPKHEEETIQDDREKIDEMCTDLREKMLKRASTKKMLKQACTNAQEISCPLNTWTHFETLVSRSSVKEEPPSYCEDISNQEDSLDERNKQQIDGDDIEDDDINETENSVNALLNTVNIKDEIDIDEDNWGHVIEDSQESCYIIDDDTSQESVSRNEEEGSTRHRDYEQCLKENIIKKEPESDDDKETKIGNEKETKVIIKQEYQEYDNAIDNGLKEEHEACLKELSSVFRASKDVKTFELSGIRLVGEVKIKDEPMNQDDYEDDIIMLNIDKAPQFEMTTEVKIENSDEPIASEPSNEDDSDFDITNLKPEVKIKEKKAKKAHTRNRKAKKMYRCKKCNVVADHKAFMLHKAVDCLQKHCSPRKDPACPWSEFKCTKCNNTFGTMRSYYTHFVKHRIRQGRCPRCLKDCRDMTNAVTHMNSHIKNSFRKIQLLNESSCVTSRTTGLYQCKTCHARVKVKYFFEHWETHLDLGAREERKLVIDEAISSYETEESSEHSLTKEEIQKLIDQLTTPLEFHDSKSSESKRCRLCARQFSRKNDVKRHAIEHLLKDAQAKPRGLTCQICRHYTNKPELYKEHMRVHAALPMFRCEMCNKCFSDSSNFAKHKKVHNVHVFSICDICKKKFHSKVGLERHMKNHEDTSPIKCDRCDAQFFSESAYKKHFRSRHDKKPLNRQCTMCHKRFNNMRTLWNHLWEQHKQRRSQADCPHCGKSFRKFQDVRAHIRDEHGPNLYYRDKDGSFKQFPKSKKRVPVISKDDLASFIKNNSEIKLEVNDETVVVLDG